MYKKAWCTCKVVVLRNKPIAFLTSWLPSPSSLLKLPNWGRYTVGFFGRKYVKSKVSKILLLTYVKTLRTYFFKSHLNLYLSEERSIHILKSTHFREFLPHHLKTSCWNNSRKKKQTSSSCLTCNMLEQRIETPGHNGHHLRGFISNL